jgi:hypothetical protein
VELVANLTMHSFLYRGATVPARGILAWWRDSGRTITFAAPVG